MKRNGFALWMLVVALSAPLGLQAQESGTVEGTVTRAGTTEGLSRVNVILMAGTFRYTATTDASGRFTFASLPIGDYVPSVSKDGYFEPIRAPRAAPFLSVSSRQHVRDVKLYLLPYSSASGRILGQDGDPVKDAVVEFLRETYLQNGTPVFEDIGLEARTNNRGDFRKVNLLPGEYYVVAKMPESKREFAPTYYPGVALLDDAMKIVVPPGEELYGVNFSLFNATLYSARFVLSKTSLIPDGLPIRVSVRMRRRDGFLSGGSTDVDLIGANVYVIPRLAPGSYDIDITWGPGFGTPQPAAHLAVTVVDRDIDIGTVSFGPVRAFTGRVAVLESDSVLPFKLERINIHRWDSPILTTTVPLTADGTFRVDLPEGRYLIRLPALPADSYIGSVRYGGSEMLYTGLLLDSEPPGPINIGVGAGVGEIAGVVRNPKGDLIYRAQVVLVPSEGHRLNPDLTRTTTTDATGAFLIPRVPPGDYSVVALEGFLAGGALAPQSSFAAKNVEFMKQFEKQETKVSVERNARKSVDLQIIANFK